MKTEKYKIQKAVLSIVLTALFLFLSKGSSFAQTTNPATWQQSAAGLRTQQDLDKKTGGLGFVVKQEDWPRLFLRGGVANAKSYNGRRLNGPTGIDLGQIKVPDTTGAFSSETTDWAHNEMVFNSGTASQLNLWVTRLSPAIAIQNQANTIRLFSGNVSGNQFYNDQWNLLDVRSTSAPSYPKYVAFPTASGITVQALSTADTPLSSLSSSINWILVWYGNNSHFLDTKWPLTYNWTVPFTAGYQADTPILLLFENKPASIKHSPEGGIDISFPSSSGYVTALPLFGREVLKASDTEGWSNGLPNNVVQRANWWASHLCSFPTRVAETYAYDTQTDTATMTETFSGHISLCSGGTSFAPLPPMLGIAKDALGVDFSGDVVDGNLPTEFGPSQGIENTNSYTWTVRGLKKYTDSRRIVGANSVPSDLQLKLENEVNKATSSGHFAPWIFIDSIFHTDFGDLYWANPADSLYQLSEVAQALPDGSSKTNLVNYLRSERMKYPPESTYDLDLTTGTIRKDYSLYWSDWEYSWKTSRKDAHLKRVPLYNFLALSRYYDLTGEALPAGLLETATNVLDEDMREQDWATMYWFRGFGDFYAHPEAVSNANRHFAGLIGFIDLAKKQNDSQAESLGRALLAKAAVLRLGMAKYPRYLYSADLVTLPPEPDWMPSYTKYNVGYIYNFNWRAPYDDARQVIFLDQFQTYLFDHSGWDSTTSGAASHYPSLTAFRDITPELARFLTDYAKQDVEIYIDKVEALFPHWYVAFAEAALGKEHNLSHPMDSFQIFMAKALIQQESPDKLATYADIPWLEAGDLFYVHKLAETIKAYKGWTWSDRGAPSGTPIPPPTHCTPLGDIDCSGQVGILDLSALLSGFGKKTGENGFNLKTDLDNSGEITILDLSTLLSNFGRARP